MAMLSAIATAVFLVLFVCITWWVFFMYRRVANTESVMLPSLLPDKAEVAGACADASHPHQ